MQDKLNDTNDWFKRIQCRSLTPARKYIILQSNQLLLCASIVLLFSLQSAAQNASIIKGNRYYKDSAFTKAEEEYRKSLTKKSTTTAQYNLGNTLYQQQKTQEAVEQYDGAAAAAGDVQTKAKALYNKGVVYHRNNQIDEAITAYKEALRLTPDDAEIRNNLQIALSAKRQQNPESKPKEQKKKEEKPKEEKKKEQQQPPPPPKISKKKAEEYLKSLTEKEKQIQEKVKKKTAAPMQPEKDW